MPLYTVYGLLYTFAKKIFVHVYFSCLQIIIINIIIINNIFFIIYDII